MYRKKHGEHANKLLNTIILEEYTCQLQYQNVTKETLETINKDITFLINEVREKI